MNIIQYQYRDDEEAGWEFAKVEFGKINLLVGDTATGKSRLLNTIFNLGRFVATKEFKHGAWDLVFEHNGTNYRWQLKTEKREDERKPGVIIKDNLWRLQDQQEISIVERDATKFSFAGSPIPKLTLQETSISLLQEEDTLRTPYEGFSTIQRRLFNQDELRTATNLSMIPSQLIGIIEKKKDLKHLFLAGMDLSVNLFLLATYFSETYKRIVEYYKRVFPFVQEARISNLAEPLDIPGGGQIPIFEIREHNSNRWIPVNEFSSGMQKVLLILTDIFIIPNGGVYMIDEYENSLGINAIDFFPQFVLDLEKDVQFFITSHHPYIINEIPPRNWYIFHRNGMQVSIRYGEAIVERFGKSKQQAFIQLINDPFYSKGVE